LDAADFLNQAGMESIQVGLFDDEEAKQIGVAIPALKALLRTSGPAREIVRRPFFLRVLAEGARAGRRQRSSVRDELIEHGG